MPKNLITRGTRGGIGVEDLAIGEGHIEQSRGGMVATYHKIPMVEDVGLIYDALTSGVLDKTQSTRIRFSGFYSKLDGGEGTYIRLPERLPDTNDIGVFITTDTATFVREYVDGKVNVEWFGAIGDGITNDLAAFLRAFKYQSVVLAQKTYLLQANTTANIELSSAFELLGNGAKLILKSILTDTLLSFTAIKPILYFNIQNLTFVCSGVTKAFKLANQDNIEFINASHTAKYEPEDSKPELPEFVYAKRKQTITGAWTFTDAPTMSAQPTLDAHPVPKSLIDAMTHIDPTPYVTTNDSKTISALKNYLTDVVCLQGGSGNKAVRRIDMQTYFAQFEDEYNALIPDDLIEATPEVGATFIAAPTNDSTTSLDPNVMFPGTTWEVIQYNDALIATGGTINATLSGTQEIKYLQVWKRTA